MDFRVLVENGSGVLVPGLPRPPERLVGIDKLVQIVALTFLTNGGRSIAYPGRAGGVRACVGQTNLDPEDPSELFADMRIIVSQVERTIKEEQVRTNRPSSERLQSLQLIDVVPDEETDSVDISVAVVNEDQQQSQAVVALT